MNNKIIYIFLAVAAVVTAFFVGKNSSKQNYEYFKQNQIASTDSIHSLLRENGTLLQWKASHILKESELSDSIKLLQKELGSKISQISQIKTKIVFDTIYINSSNITNDTINNRINFMYNDKWLSFKGIYNKYPQSFNIYNINIPTNLSIGVTKDHNIFINSDNPYLKVSDISGAYVIENMMKVKTEKKWHHGVGVGFGIQYGLIKNKIDIGPQISYNVIYKF